MDSLLGNKMSRHVPQCLSMAIGLVCSADFPNDFKHGAESGLRHQH